MKKITLVNVSVCNLGVKTTAKVIIISQTQNEVK